MFRSTKQMERHALHARDGVIGKVKDFYFDDQQWHIRYRRQLRVWASGTRGGKGSSVMFDMTSRDRSRQFAEAVAFELEEIRSGNVSWDGDPRMRRHLLNARRYPVNGVVSIAKDSRESRHKIDLAVGFVGARMVRRLVLTTKKKGGTVW